MKKPFFETVVGRILLVLGKIGLSSALKKAKFNKTEKDAKNIDEIIDNIP